jgi:hypothetical protein
MPEFFPLLALEDGSRGHSYHPELVFVADPSHDDYNSA